MRDLLEQKLARCVDFEQVCLVGSGLPQPILLTVLSETARNEAKDELKARLTEVLKQVNQELEDHEAINKIIVMKEDWTVENNILTPSMKIKRNVLETIHAEKYTQWYEHKELVLWE